MGGMSSVRKKGHHDDVHDRFRRTIAVGANISG